jgi:hypothetical protein
MRRSHLCHLSLYRLDFASATLHRALEADMDQLDAHEANARASSLGAGPRSACAAPSPRPLRRLP